MKKAAALIGKFSATLEKPGAKPKPAPPVIPSVSAGRSAATGNNAGSAGERSAEGGTACSPARGGDARSLHGG